VLLLLLLQLMLFLAATRYGKQELTHAARFTCDGSSISYEKNRNTRLRSEATYSFFSIQSPSIKCDSFCHKCLNAVYENFHQTVPGNQSFVAWTSFRHSQSRSQCQHGAAPSYLALAKLSTNLASQQTSWLDVVYVPPLHCR